MVRVRKLIVQASIIAAAAVLAVPDAHGQNPLFQTGPGLQPSPYAPATGFSSGIGSPLSPYAAPGGLSANPTISPLGRSAAMSSSPAGGGTLANSQYPGAFNPYMYNQGMGYYPSYYQDPFNGYLTGGASVISAQGQFMISKQQQNLMIEQVRQAKIDTRRKIFDEFLYERERTPTLEEEREKGRLQERDRARNAPPVTEVLSAKALNDLLVDLQKLQTKGSLATYRGPALPLVEDDLKRINVTSTKGGGNIGLLKNDGRLSWPVALNGPEFKEERERLNSLAQEVVKQAGFNTPIDGGTLRQMSQDLDKINKSLVRNVGDLPPSQYIEAKRFLGHFDDAIKALQQPDAGNYFTKKIRAKSVAELVDYMTKNGLQFAPAVAGDEGAYVAVHRGLAAYDQALLTQAGDQKGGAEPR